MFSTHSAWYRPWIAALLCWGHVCSASGSWDVLEFTAYDDQNISTTAFDIDHLGNVIGEYPNALTGHTTGFIRSRRGDYRDVVFPDTGTMGTYLRSINSKGEVFGFAIVGGSQVNFIYHSRTGLFEKVQFANFEPLAIVDRNEAGAMVGIAQTGKGAVYSFLAFKTRVRRLAISGSSATEVRTINDCGQISGYYISAAGQRAFIASATGALLVDDMRGPRGEMVFPSSLDNDGSFVGRSSLGEGYWFDAMSGQGKYLQVAGRTGVLPSSLRSGVIVGSTYDLQTNMYRAVVMREK